jgi:hypothetical protein
MDAYAATGLPILVYNIPAFHLPSPSSDKARTRQGRCSRTGNAMPVLIQIAATTHWKEHTDALFTRITGAFHR